LVDFYTKPLERATFDDLLAKLGDLNTHSPVWGGAICLFTLVNCYIQIVS
jgi:hypothetical protein